MSRPFLRSSVAGIAVGVVVSAWWSLARPDSDPGVLDVKTEVRFGEEDTPDTIPGRPATKQEIREEVDQLLAFIEEVRGLKPKDDDFAVKVELQDDRSFEAGLTEVLSAWDDLSGYGATLAALGVIEPGDDLTEIAQDGAARGVQGYWDPDGETIIMRGTTLSPAIRAFLVHELVHVVQQETFGGRPDVDTGEAQADLAAMALREGDAEYVRGEFVLTLPLAEQRSVEAALSGVLTPPLARTELTVLDVVFGFPYRFGPEFVADLIEHADGEFDQLNAAYRRPPSTVEQVLHPEKYRNDEDEIDPTDPEPEGEQIDEGTLGEFVLAYLLDPALGDEDALDAAAGWGGDRYVTARSDGRLTTTVHFVMDSEKDRTELVDALRSWVRRHGSASVREESREVVLEASVRDPGSSSAESRGGERSE